MTESRFLCAHCGSPRVTWARIEGDRLARVSLDCHACGRRSSPLTCGQRVQRGDAADWCGAPGVAVCSGCDVASCGRHLAPRRPRGRRTAAALCSTCVRRARMSRLRRTVRVLPHPADLYYSGVER